MESFIIIIISSSSINAIASFVIPHKPLLSRYAHLFRMINPPHSTQAPISKAMATTMSTDNPANTDRQESISTKTKKLITN